MPQFATNTALPRYLRNEQERIRGIAEDFGLDFFSTIFEMLSYDQMNEIAAYGGFPNRYPHWRWGMDYERLSKSNEYGLSKIYELVINNNPSIAYLLEGNSLIDQKLVMCHVYGHVDFFKNNFAFRATDLDRAGPAVQPVGAGPSYNPNRRWIDKLANHASFIRRIIDKQGIDAVESLIDQCLSLDNLIDPWSPFMARDKAPDEEPEDKREIVVPRIPAKVYMDEFINPEEYILEQKKRLEKLRDVEAKHPVKPQQDVLLFLLENAPLERWERAILEIVRSEAYYFLPQMQTKIMNEGWASYWHSRMMTEKVCDASEILDYADNNAGVMATSEQQLNPYKLGVELYRSIEERWNRGQFGREWELCDNLDQKKDWDRKLGAGRDKIFEVRSLYNDVTFIDEFLTEEFAVERKLFTFSWSNRNERFEVQSRGFREVKEQLLFQLTNHGNPFIFVENANHENRGELLLSHEHRGVDLRTDYCEQAMIALNRLWKRPVCLMTTTDGKPVMMRYDGELKVEEVSG